LPVGGELHGSQIHRRMSVEESLEPLAPEGIRSNAGKQRLDDQRNHVKAVVADAACFPCHGQFRLDGKFSIPQPAVMRADVANRRQGVEPAHKDGLWLIEFAGDFLAETGPQVFVHFRQGTEADQLRSHPHRQFRFRGVLGPIVADENFGRPSLFAPENPHEVGMIECRREVGGVRITEDAQIFSYFVGNDGPDADLNPVQGFAHEPTQIGIESIEINDLLEVRSRTKIVGGGGL